MSSDNIEVNRDLYSTGELTEVGIRLLYIGGMYINMDKISSIYVTDDAAGGNWNIIIQMTGYGAEKVNLSGTTARLHMASMKTFLKEHLYGSIAMELTGSTDESDE